jgi:predicted nucleic acid-binding protein
VGQHIKVYIFLFISSYPKTSAGLKNLSLEILKTAAEIDDIPELHDRLIAATAKYLDLPLITNDPMIRDSRFIEVLK